MVRVPQHVEGRGQLCAATSVIALLCGFQQLNSQVSRLVQQGLGCLANPFMHF